MTPRLDLTASPRVRALLKSRRPQLVVQIALLGGFALAVTAGLTGTPVGNRNAAIVLVWIAWWALLMLAAVPLLGRAWCSVCPLPLAGEWLQRGAILGPAGPSAALGAGRRLGLGLRWPRALRGLWLQNGAFLLVAVFSAVVLTQPRISALLLLGMVLAAVGMSLVFERRAFCRGVCPVGGFIGLYAQAAPLELRVADPAICAAHTEKSCYQGSSLGYGCPWQVYPGSLQKNTYCGMCLECLRTCPHDNVLLYLRPPGADLQVRSGRRLDEAYKAFILLTSALVYTGVLLGPWGALKTAAYAVGTLPWAGYALGVLSLALLIVPGLFALAVLAGRRLAPSARSLRQAVADYAVSLVPLGLAAWIAFSLALVLANGSYIWPVLSDPLGWGWDLLGTAGTPWTPYLTAALPGLQIAVVLGGLGWSVITARRVAREAAPEPLAACPPIRRARQALPVAVFNALAAGGLLWLLVG